MYLFSFFFYICSTSYWFTKTPCIFLNFIKDFHKWYYLNRSETHFFFLVEQSLLSKYNIWSIEMLETSMKYLNINTSSMSKGHWEMKTTIRTCGAHFIFALTILCSWSHFLVSSLVKGVKNDLSKKTKAQNSSGRTINASC